MKIRKRSYGKAGHIHVRAANVPTHPPPKGPKVAAVWKGGGR
jgi:hypothetical protein